MSVRGRLTLWYAGTVALVLAGFAAGSYTLVHHRLYKELDMRLHTALEVIEHSAYDAEIVAVNEHAWEELGVRTAAVWDVHGTVLASIGRDLPEPGSADRGPLTESWDRGQGSVRVMVAHGVGDDNRIVAVAEPEAALRHELGLLAWTFGIGVAVAVSIAVAGGWFLVRHALTPVDRMAQRAREITADKLSERLPVANPNDEFGRLARSFNEMIERLERSFDELRRFTADASHELRTPLTALRAVGEVDLTNDEATRETVAAMLEEADRLAQLVDSMLELARAPHIRLVREELDLSELGRDVVEQLAVLAEERDQSLAVESNGKVPVLGDRTILRRAIINLVDNAVRHGRRSGRIRVRARRNGAEARLSVADDGPGVAPKHREKIFDRFYRIDAARSGNAGTGLGLALARWAVEAHGGRLELESKLGEGSTFHVILPIDDEGEKT